MKTREFRESVDLPVPAQAVLDNLHLAGVNEELRPLVRMTCPAGSEKRPIFEWPAGQTLFASWILLFGVLPIDRHSFFLERIEPGRGFHESSSSLTNRSWKHRRIVETTPEGCRVTDTVSFECRLPLLGALLKPVYRMVFRHRHRVLKRRYASAA